VTVIVSDKHSIEIYAQRSVRELAGRIAMNAFCVLQITLTVETWHPAVAYTVQSSRYE
jgi:hypothetical protein